MRVVQKIQEEDKTRNQVFEGMVIAIKGKGDKRTFTVRRIGVQQIGIERIFPIDSPNIEAVEISQEGVRGVRHSKLYFTRDKSKREIEKIYSRQKKKEKAKKDNKKKSKEKSKSKKIKKETKKKSTKSKGGKK